MGVKGIRKDSSMRSCIEYKCNNCGHEGLNTRAVPDVPELVRYDHSPNGMVHDCDGYHTPYKKAAAMLAAKDKEIQELKEKLDVVSTERHADAEYIGHLQAELAQIKEQEAVAWMHPEARWTDVSKQEVAVHCKVGTYPLPLYDAPVSDSLKAECDRYKEALGLCQRTLAMIIDPKSIVSTTSIIAFASATEAEAKARAALKGYSHDKG